MENKNIPISMVYIENDLYKLRKFAIGFDSSNNKILGNKKSGGGNKLVIVLLGIRHKLVDIVRHSISRFFPIKKNKVFFDSTPDYCDNSRAMSDYIITDNHYDVYWAVEKIPQHPKPSNVHFILKSDKKAYWYHTITSQYIFATHMSNIWANPSRQVSVCLWHGSPLKKIALLQNCKNTGVMRQFKFVVAASEYYVPIMKSCFGKKMNILPTGLPRNDFLFSDSDVLEKLNIHFSPNEKLIVYLPTFRKVDDFGNADSSQELFTTGLLNMSSEKSVIQLNDFMRKLNVLFVVKPHPADVNQLKYRKLSNVIIIPQSVFTELDIQLNKLLHFSDALITDFSGVFIDYLNLDRPIGFLLTDLEDYTAKRGFLFENPLDYMPGDKLFSEEDFKNFCRDVANSIDKTRSERLRLKYVFNDYSDNNNCKRVAEAIGMKINL